MKDFGKKLKKLMFDFGITQEDLANKLKLDQSYISKLQAGKRTPTIKTLEQFADFFKVPINFFLQNSNNTITGNNNAIGNQNNIGSTDTTIRTKLLSLANSFYSDNQVVRVITTKKQKPIRFLNIKNSCLIAPRANMLIEDYEEISAKEFYDRFNQKVSAQKVLLALYLGRDTDEKNGFNCGGDL